jgi:hypothetical protein
MSPHHGRCHRVQTPRLAYRSGRVDQWLKIKKPPAGRLDRAMIADAVAASAGWPFLDSGCQPRPLGNWSLTEPLCDQSAIGRRGNVGLFATDADFIAPQQTTASFAALRRQVSVDCAVSTLTSKLNSVF